IERRWQAEPTPTVLADPPRLERVIDNLLENALRHTPAGGKVRLRLTMHHERRRPGGAAETRPDVQRRTSDPPHAVLIAVHNTGSAIPPEDLPRVFERFYQVDKARGAGSSGLGLAISREIAQAHGGRCWVESSQERGTE